MQKLALVLLLALSALQCGVLAEPRPAALRQSSHSAAHQRRELWGMSWYSSLLFHLHICHEDTSKDHHIVKSHCEHHPPPHHHHHHSGGGGGGGSSSNPAPTPAPCTDCDDCADDDDDCKETCCGWGDDGHAAAWGDDGHDDWADDGHDDDAWDDDGHDDDEWDDDGHSASYLSANGSKGGYHSSQAGSGKRGWIIGALAAACAVGGLAFLVSRKRKRSRDRDVPEDVYYNQEMATTNTKLSRTQSLKLKMAAASASVKSKFRRGGGAEENLYEDESIETNEYGVVM